MASKRINVFQSLLNTVLFNHNMVKYFSFYHNQTILVSEADEELISDEDDNYNFNKKKKKVFSLSQFSRLMNKKIYSDEFDMSFESKNFKKRFMIGSVVECPINEDNESED